LARCGIGIGIELVPQSAEIEAKNVEAVLAKPTFQNLKNAARGTVALQQQHRPADLAEVGTALDHIALQGETDVLKIEPVCSRTTAEDNAEDFLKA
jgi:hypothetical protein